MRLTIGIALTALLVGCATTEAYWVRPGASSQDFYQESAQCRAQAAGVAGMVLMQMVLVYENCLAGKGWYREERQVPTALGRALAR